MNGNQQGVQLIESEDDKKKKEGQAQPGSAFVGGTSPTGAKPAPSAPSASQQARAAQTAGPTRGTGFTGVGRYLQANVGSRLGEQVAGRVAQTGQQAATRLGQSVQQFEQQLGQQTDELTQREALARGALQRIAGQPQNVDSTAEQPLTPSQEEMAAYSAISGGQFQAPTGLTDIGDIRSQAQLAGQLAAGTRDTAGRLGLLRQVVGRGPQQYTKGQSALDALLLGQAGGQLAAARRASAGLERRVGTEETLAAERARQFGAKASRAKEEITGEASGIESTTGADIAARQSQYTTDINKLIEDIKEQVATGIISPEVAGVLSQYGVTPNTRFYDQDFDALSRFLAVSKGPAEEVTATTKEEAARLQALKKLTGMGREYTQEELEKVGTTIDPKTGLAVSPEEFKSKFVTPGEKRVVSAAKKVRSFFPELRDYVSEDATFAPKTLEILESKKRELPEKMTGLQNQINRYDKDIRRGKQLFGSLEMAQSLLEKGGDFFQRAAAERYVEALQNHQKTAFELKRIKSQIPVLDDLLNEYAKGRSLQVMGDSAK